MTRPDPLGRCDAVGARSFLKELLSGQSARDLRWRLIEKDSGKLERFFIDLASLSHEGVYLAKHAICASFVSELTIRKSPDSLCFSPVSTTNGFLKIVGRNRR